MHFKKASRVFEQQHKVHSCSADCGGFRPLGMAASGDLCKFSVKINEITTGRSILCFVCLLSSCSLFLLVHCKATDVIHLLLVLSLCFHVVSLWQSEFSSAV